MGPWPTSIPNDYKHKADVTRLWSRGKVHGEKRVWSSGGEGSLIVIDHGSI